MAFSVSRFLPRDGINFLQERKKERSGISRSISRRNSSRRLAEVMGAKLFRSFYRSRGEIGVNIEVSKRIGKPATYNTVLVKLGNNRCHLQMRRSRNSIRVLTFSQENVRSRGARAPSAQTAYLSSNFSPENRFHPISKNLIRCVSFLPRTHHLDDSFPPRGPIDRSIKIFHGINVIRYVNKRYVVGFAWFVQLNDRDGAYTRAGWEKIAHIGQRSF